MSGGTIPASGITLGRRAVVAHGRFYFWMSLLMLGSVLVGFSPTLYLRSLFDTEPLPAYLYVHGVMMTAWFVWLVVQSSLVRGGNTDRHRRLGASGAIIGISIVVLGPMATIGAVARARTAGFTWDTEVNAMPQLGVSGVSMLDFMTEALWSNLISIAAFAILLGAAIMLRRQPQLHKRLIVFASIAIVGPALVRMSRLPGLGGEHGLFIPIALTGLIVAVLAHDLIAERRLHKGTVIGLTVIVAAKLLQLIVAASPFGREFVLAIA